MEWRAFMETSVGQVFSQADKEWLPERLRMDLEDIGVVHFSGEVKMWRRILAATSLESGDRRREVSHALDATNGEGGETGDVAFAERLMSYQPGHDLWISKTAEPEHYQYYGCRRDGRRIFTGEKDITDALDLMAQKVLQVAERAAKVWRECYEKLAEPGLLEELQKPRVPEGCIQLGTCVEVSWPIGQGSHETVRWFQAQVLGVHDNRTMRWSITEEVIGVILNAMFTQNVWGSWDPRPRAQKWMRWQVFTVVQGLGWAPNNDVSCIVQHFAAVRVVAPVLCVQILWIDLELYLVSFVLFVTGVEQELLPYEALTRPYKTCLCVCVCQLTDSV